MMTFQHYRVVIPDVLIIPRTALVLYASSREDAFRCEDEARSLKGYRCHHVEYRPDASSPWRVVSSVTLRVDGAACRVAVSLEVANG